MELNTDSYIKLIGHQVAEDALRCIKAFDTENERQRLLFRAKLEADDKRHKLEQEIRNNLIREYINSGQYKADFDEILKPYYHEVVIRNGWWLWPRVTEMVFSRSELVKAREEVRVSLRDKCPAFWNNLPNEWFTLKPSVILDRTTATCWRELNNPRPTWRGISYPMPGRRFIPPYYTGRLHQLTKLSGDVYLTLSDYHQLLKAVADLKELEKNAVPG